MSECVDTNSFPHNLFDNHADFDSVGSTRTITVDTPSVVFKCMFIFHTTTAEVRCKTLSWSLALPGHLYPHHTVEGGRVLARMS
jgi:hypothetical protein